MSLRNLTVLFLDLQTTGANPAGGHPLEIAWCFGKASDAIAGPIESRILKQEAAIPKRIQQLTGITEDLLRDAIECSVVEQLIRSDVRLMTADSLLPSVIHFSRFEVPFLQSCFTDVANAISIACTHQIATRLYPNMPSRGLRGLAGYFGMSLGDCKRAATHVEATRFVWSHLCEALEKQGLSEFHELTAWLSNTKPAKRTKYEYPLNPEIRLRMPDCPGIYRMLSKNGEVLYVGKATSLRHRVNSYFRGRKHKDSFKQEMLSRVWDIRVTECQTALEASLLEVEEIKRLSPPYNISMNQADRDLVFYSSDFSICSTQQSQETPRGPFRSDVVMDSFIRLVSSLKSGHFDKDIFFDEVDEVLIREGFELFCTKHDLTVSRLSNYRSLMALALSFWRKFRAMADIEDPDVQDASQPEPAEVKAATGRRRRKRTQPEPLKPEEVADKFERLLMRSARAYLQSQRLTKLLTCEVEFVESNGVERKLSVTNGIVDVMQGGIAMSIASDEFAWTGLTLNTYDRMRVLDTELQRIAGDGQPVRITSKRRHRLAAHSRDGVSFLELPTYLPSFIGR